MDECTSLKLIKLFDFIHSFVITTLPEGDLVVVQSVVWVADFGVVEHEQVVWTFVVVGGVFVVNGFVVLEHEQALVVLGAFVVVGIGVVVPMSILHIISSTETHSPSTYSRAYPGMQSHPFIAINVSMLHFFK